MDVDGGKIWQHLPGFAKSQTLTNVWHDPRARADTDRNTGADGAEQRGYPTAQLLGGPLDLGVRTQ
jgi:hypothetical protein